MGCQSSANHVIVQDVNNKLKKKSACTSQERFANSLYKKLRHLDA